MYGEVSIFDGSDNPLAASAIGNPYLFTGRRYDPESGNYYYRARMYSPWLGRFLSMDPLGFDAGDYNLYRYVFNNSVNLTDPTGEIVPLLIAGVLITIKVADYAWTTWDIYQSKLVLEDECAADVEKLLAGLNIALAVIFELLEPDDALPVGVPADDVARKLAVKAAREGLEEGGIEGFERAVRHALGDEIAEKVFKEMGLDNLSIGWTGDIGEMFLKNLGGKPQVSMNTSLGRRVIDQLVGGVAHESKVGYTSLTKQVKRQIAKDSELVATGQIDAVVWHFFTSPVTGKGGPSSPLRRTLTEAGIQIIIH